MNFQSFYDTVKQIALSTRTVESFSELSPYEVWNSLNMVYPSFNCNINFIRRVGNFNIVNLSLYYGGKLKNDSSNLFQIQSDGFRAIINVINHLKENFEIEDVEEIQIFPFWQQFADILAGCYADVNIFVPVEDTCENFDKE